jgi:hypothetical protein
MKIKAMGITPQLAPEILAIAESQTRIVAWCLPPETRHPSATDMPCDIALAQDALDQSDEALLSTILVSRARSWIESSHSAVGIASLKTVAQKLGYSGFSVGFFKCFQCRGLRGALSI